MTDDVMRILQNVVSRVDESQQHLYIEVSIPGLDRNAIKLKMHEDRFYLFASDNGYLKYATIYTFCGPVRPEEAKAYYENGLLRIHVPFKDFMDGAIEIAVN